MAKLLRPKTHIEVHSYAPGDGTLAFVCCYAEDCPEGRRGDAARVDNPSREECESLIPDGWELFTNGPYLRARPIKLVRSAL